MTAAEVFEPVTDSIRTNTDACPFILFVLGASYNEATVEKG